MSQASAKDGSSEVDLIGTADDDRMEKQNTQRKRDEKAAFSIMKYQCSVEFI